MKETYLMVHCISSFEGTSHEKIQDTAISSFTFFHFTSDFLSYIIYNFPQLFRTSLHSTFSEKK